MSSDSFDQLKCVKLAGLDLSRKGSIDDPLRTIIQLLNAHKDYFTLSSCSGRVMVTSRETQKEKQSLPWHFTSHDVPTKDELYSALVGPEPVDGLCRAPNCVLKFEPFVLHVQCRDLSSAKNLLTAALSSGHRNSGIVPAKGGRFVLGVRSTLTLEVPLSDSNNLLLVSKEFIEFLATTIEAKFEQNQSYLSRFEGNLKNLVDKNESE